MRTSSALMFVLVTILLLSCNRADDTRMTSVAPETAKGAVSAAEPPPAAVRTDVNAAEVEEFMKARPAATPAEPEKNGPDQRLYVAAQDAAARAPDTASADQAKKSALESETSGERTSAPGNAESRK